MTEECVLSSHPFVKRLLDDIRPTISILAQKVEKQLKETGELKKRKTPANLPEPYNYIHYVLHYIDALVRTIERLRQVQIYMRMFPARTTLEKAGITQDVWLRYHYGVFVTTMVGSYDIALIATNAVFRWGIPERECRRGVVQSNAWALATGIDKRLEVINKIVTPFKGVRNDHVHRGQVPDLEYVEPLEIFSLVNRGSTKEYVKQRKLNSLYRYAVREHESQMKTEIKKLDKGISGLLDGLLPIYERTMRQLPIPDLDKLAHA